MIKRFNRKLQPCDRKEFLNNTQKIIIMSLLNLTTLKFKFLFIKMHTKKIKYTENCKKIFITI